MSTPQRRRSGGMLVAAGCRYTAGTRAVTARGAARIRASWRVNCSRWRIWVAVRFAGDEADSHAWQLTEPQRSSRPSALTPQQQHARRLQAAGQVIFASEPTAKSGTRRYPRAKPHTTPCPHHHLLPLRLCRPWVGVLAGHHRRHQCLEKPPEASLPAGQEE